MTITKLDVTQALMDEHRIIERMLRVLIGAAGRVERGEEVSPSVFARGLDFIRNFADRWHHGKEEDLLFAALEKHGLPRVGGPLAVMLLEHEEGRKYVRGMAGALELWQEGDKSAAKTVARNARGYCDVLSRHIPKEDQILYPMGEDMLPEGEKKELLAAYAGAERQQGEGKGREYLGLVEELEKELAG